MDAKKRWDLVCWLLAGMVALSQGGANAGDRGGNVSKPKGSQIDASGQAQFHLEKVTDRAGKVFWIVRFGNTTYRIPHEYVTTIVPGTIRIRMHWPTTMSVSGASQRGRVQGSDLVIIMLEPPRIPPIRDSYEVLGPSRTNYHQTPSDQYPGLMQTFYHGKPGAYLVSSREGPRTPSGNPYLFTAPRKEDPNGPCGDTRIALPEGNSVRVQFFAKHVSDWHRIYPVVLRLIESFKGE